MSKKYTVDSQWAFDEFIKGLKESILTDEIHVYFKSNTTPYVLKERVFTTFKEMTWEAYGNTECFIQFEEEGCFEMNSLPDDLYTGFDLIASGFRVTATNIEDGHTAFIFRDVANISIEGLIYKNESDSNVNAIKAINGELYIEDSRIDVTTLGSRCIVLDKCDIQCGDGIVYLSNGENSIYASDSDIALYDTRINGANTPIVSVNNTPLQKDASGVDIPRSIILDDCLISPNDNSKQLIHVINNGYSSSHRVVLHDIGQTYPANFTGAILNPENSAVTLVLDHTIINLPLWKKDKVPTRCHIDLISSALTNIVNDEPLICTNENCSATILSNGTSFNAIRPFDIQRAKFVNITLGKINMGDVCDSTIIGDNVVVYANRIGLYDSPLCNLNIESTTGPVLFNSNICSIPVDNLTDSRITVNGEGRSLHGNMLNGGEWYIVSE